MPGQYGVIRQDADTLRFTSLAPEPRLVGLLRRISDRAGGTVGWRLDARVVVRGPVRKVWPLPEDPLVATGLMIRREAKAAIAAAGITATPENGVGRMETAEN